MIHDWLRDLTLTSDRRYTREHVWVAMSGGGATVGFTPLIARWLQRIDEVEMIAADGLETVVRGEAVGTIRGLAAGSGSYCSVRVPAAMAGACLEPNHRLQRQRFRRAESELILSDPLGEGFLYRMLGVGEAYDELWDADAYRAHLESIAMNGPGTLDQLDPVLSPEANPARPRGVFLSYRRADTIEWARRIESTLKRHFGGVRVFRDQTDMKHGRSYKAQIAERIEEADIVVVLIGPEFFVASPTGQPRLFEPDDDVRIEIRTALELGKLVVPVLVDGVDGMAGDEMPEDIRQLADHHAFKVEGAADLDTLAVKLRPDVYRAGGHEARELVGSDGRPIRSPGHRPGTMRTAARQLLHELDWQEGGDGCLYHPRYPGFRIRGLESVYWLEEATRTKILQRQRWARIRPISLVPGQERDFELAAINPADFLARKGRLVDGGPKAVAQRFREWF